MKQKILVMALSLTAELLLLGCPNPVSEPLKSSNADLSAITLSTGTLSPDFAADATAYTVSVPNSTTSITITVTKSDSNATVSGDSGVAKTLSEGANTITITVTAQDGITEKNYVVTVTRSYDYVSANIGILKYVPAGRFQRDATASNISVISTAYRMSQHEITRAQFQDIMGTDPSIVGNSSGTNDPVQYVNWYHAIAFCNKLSIAEGLTPVYAVSGITDWAAFTYANIPTSNNATWNAATATWSNNGYRLPTEMEWMWAAMGAPADGQGGGTNTTGYAKSFAGSTGSNEIGSYAVFGYYGSETERTTTERSNPVGSKAANELGFYDMSGNVFEWCWDWFAEYPTGPLTDYQGAASGSSRILRGGSWYFNANLCTVASRSTDDDDPGGQYYFGVGFRVMRP